MESLSSVKTDSEYNTNLMFYENESITQKYYELNKYFLINKPAGVLSCKVNDDFKNKNEKIPTIYQIANQSGFPTDKVGLVGRLDMDTSGVMLMTSDSRLNRALTYPSEEDNPYKEKEYLMILSSQKLCNLNDFEKLEQEMSEPFSFSRKGVIKHATESKIKILKYWQDDKLSKNKPHLGWCIEVKVSIKEGKHHQIRRIALRSKMTVISLQRVRIANILKIDSIPLENDCRWVTYEEVANIYKGLNLFYNQEEVCGKKFK